MKLLFFDLETTGLSRQKDHILEAGAVVTEGLNLQEVDRFHRVVRTPIQVLTVMNEWCKRQHGASGLVEACMNSSKSKELSTVDLELRDFILKHWPNAASGNMEDRPQLAGNCVGQFDTVFVDRLLPETNKVLHYRVLDVSSFKIVFAALGQDAEKSTGHRVMSDCEDSIRELKDYLKFIVCPHCGKLKDGPGVHYSDSGVTYCGEAKA